MDNKMRNLYEVLSRENRPPCEVLEVVNAKSNFNSKIEDCFYGLKQLSVLDMIEIYNVTQSVGVLALIRNEEKNLKEMLGVEELDIFNIPSNLYPQIMNAVMEEAREFNSKKCKPIEEYHNFLWISLMIESLSGETSTYSIPSDTDLRKIKNLNSLRGTVRLYEKVFGRPQMEVLPDVLIAKGFKGIREELHLQKQEVTEATGIAPKMFNIYEGGVKKLTPELISKIREVFYSKME